MNQTDQEYLHLKQGIRDLYEVGGHLFSTRSADAFRASDRQSGSGICLWVLRHSLMIGSEAVQRFLTRSQALERLEPSVARLLDFGVDKQGLAFAALPALDGQQLTAGRLEPMEAERRFVSCIKVVEALHQAGLMCGDLCGSSFWTKRSGEIELIGVMGSFDVEAAQTAMMPPPETIPFIAPEQRAGGSISPATDVFALGVLGYFLFTQRFPFGEGPAALANPGNIDSVATITSLVPNAPAWCDELIRGALNVHSQQRFSSAGEMLTIMNRLRVRSMSPEQTTLPAVIKPKRAAHDGEVRQFSGADVRPKSEPQSVPASSAMPLPPWLMVIIFAVVIPGILVVGYKAFKGPSTNSASVNTKRPVAIPGQGLGLESGSQLISSSGVDEPERERQLAGLVSSDDPLAHEVMVRAATMAESPEIRRVIERAVFDRATRLGLKLSSDEARLWLRAFNESSPPASYEAVLRALDKTRPASEQAVALRQAYPQAPDFVLRLAVSLALDQGDLDGYQPLLAQLVGDSLTVGQGLQIKDINQHSVLSLILAHPQLGNSFGGDVVKRIKDIPDADIFWLIKLLGDRGDVNVRAVAAEAANREGLSAVRKSYLELVKARGNLPLEIAQVLVRAASGSIRVDDIAVIGGWYDLDSERVLLLMLADLEDPVLLVEAFDTLAGKSISNEPTATILNWVRREHWNDRVHAARAIGIFGSSTVPEPERIDEALTELDKLGKNQKVISAILSAAPPALGASLVARYPEEVGVFGMINLLASPDKNTRISVIHQLGKVNDIGASKLIIDHYQEEKDSEVRQIYKDVFWFIRERKE